MPDKETVINVIKALEICAIGTNSCTKCPLKNNCHGTSNAAMVAAIELLKKQQPIVLCKDCKKRPLDEHETELNGELYRYCELHRRWTTDDWFCADGERW